jgi:hypothetical protein
MPVYTDRCDDGVRLGVDDADIIRSRVDDVDFVLLAVGGNAGGLAPHVQSLRQRERPQIDHADRVALAVGDVGVLTKCGAVVRKRWLAEIPPPQTAKDGNQHCDEEELSQRQSNRRTESLAEAGRRILGTSLAHFGFTTFNPRTWAKWRWLNVATVPPRSIAVAATIKS